MAFIDFIEMFWAAYAPLVILILYLGGRSAWSGLRSLLDRRVWRGSRYADRMHSAADLHV
jgi:hypothetical protein